MNRCIKKAKLLLAKWYLQNTPASKMLKQSERAAKALFFNDYGKTDTLKGSFPNQKTSNKASVFTDDYIGDVIQKNKAKIASVMISSGTSGSYSLGLITHTELKKAPLATDFFFGLVLGAKSGNTFVINALSMGVKVNSYFAISDTGPRADLVIALLKTISPYYDKTVIIGDVLFIKQLVEESMLAGINWQKMNCWFVSGGDWMPETLRTYVHDLTNKNPLKADNGYWLGEYGVSEIGYPLFFETDELVKIRANRLLNTRLEKETFPEFTTPFIFHYLPGSYYLESLPYDKYFSELVFTTLSKTRLIKLQRYATGDWGELIKNDFSDKVTLQLPLVRFWGRLNNFIQVGKRLIYVSDIKELLFEDNGLAAMITGFFSMYLKNGLVQIDIQLKNGADINTFETRLFVEQIGFLYGGMVKVKFHQFIEMNKFLSIDFERKFNPLNV